jgi:hypothetical protein
MSSKPELSAALLSAMNAKKAAPKKNVTPSEALRKVEQAVAEQEARDRARDPFEGREVVGTFLSTSGEVVKDIRERGEPRTPEFMPVRNADDPRLAPQRPRPYVGGDLPPARKAKLEAEALLLTRQLESRGLGHGEQMRMQVRLKLVEDVLRGVRADEG